MEILYSFDVGGTEIKAGVTDMSGALLGSMLSFDAKAQRDKAAILENFREAFTALAAQVKYPPIGVAMAFPGPFDYENGICLIQGVGKYESLYKANLRNEFSAMAGNRPVRFLNDVTAFAIGESLLDKDLAAQRVLCVCIGTGCGSAFLVDGRPAPAGTKGVPNGGMIYPLPYKQGRLDDYLSKRGLLRITQAGLGRPVDGLELSALAQAGDDAAKNCFAQFGRQLPEALSTVIDDFAPTKIILGGQIAKSFELFGAPLRELCAANGISLKVTPETSQSALRGLSTLF